MENDNEKTDTMTSNGVDDNKPDAEDSIHRELLQAKNDYLYLAAEFDNFKKQTLKERSELIRYGGERLVRDLLNVIDNFERALATETNPDNFMAFREGISMTATELKGVLQKHGIQELDAQGQMFDPQLHEAIGSEETESYEPGFVSQVLKKAYKIHDRLIRPAQVVVAKAPPEKG
jgi:molecular chaperone GrpE